MPSGARSRRSTPVEWRTAPCTPRNILVTDLGPVLVDFGTAQESAQPPAPGDRPRRAARLAGPVRRRRRDHRVRSTGHRARRPRLRARLPPTARPLEVDPKGISKAQLKQLRDDAAAAAGVEPPPLERLVRVKPKTLLTIAALAGAFYVMLPQLANVDDSFEAMGSANWWWLLAAALLSGSTYLASAIGLIGGVSEPLPLGPTVLTQMASSFVNRVTPANVGGMALNVRFMQKAGVEPASAVTGMGLNVLVGGVVHLGLLVVFFAWAGQSSAGTFKIPVDSKMLVDHRRRAGPRRRRRRHPAGAAASSRKHVIGFLRRSWANMRVLARSPSKLVQLVRAASFGVTLAYICALAASVAAFDGDVSFAEVGAVYLGASMIAAAAPTPGGLGALEAGLVAGFTGVGLDTGIAVAAVLCYRLVTYWLPILPGWISFHLLERRNLI